jgi:hypothetical protein
MPAPATHTITLPGALLERGFWLYVWRVESPLGQFLYVGRTGDNSSPNASAPYTRMGQHLGSIDNQNALHNHLVKRQIDPGQCTFHMIAHGPIHPEVERPADKNERKTRRNELFNVHLPIRNKVGALERVLAEALAAAGYTVLNTVKWKHTHEPAAWAAVQDAFSAEFPRLKDVA